MLAASVAVLHAQGVEAAVRLLRDSSDSHDGGLGVRMAQATELRGDAAACEVLLEALAGQKAEATAGSEARRTIVAAMAQVQARERAVWALLEALLHG